MSWVEVVNLTETPTMGLWKLHLDPGEKAVLRLGAPLPCPRCGRDILADSDGWVPPHRSYPDPCARGGWVEGW